MKKVKPYGYLIDTGYKGWIGNKFILFPTETEYLEYIREFNEDKAELISLFFFRLIILLYNRNY